MKDSSRSRIAVDADRLLELEDEAGPDRLDDRRRAALLAMLGVREVDVLERVHVRDRPAAGHRGHPVPEEVPAAGEDPGRARPADELVGADEDRVLVVELGVRARPVGRQLDLDVRRGRAEVPERERAVPVEEDGDRPGVAQDPGHVGGGREAADLQPPILVGGRAPARAPRGRSGRRRPRGSSRRRRSTRATAARCCGARTVR